MVSRDTIVYFGYGSNMFTRWLRGRVPSARAIGTGQLKGHRLRWHKRSSDGSAKCDIVNTGKPEDTVWGVLYEIPVSEKPRLDKVEGLGKGYLEKAVLVVAQTAVVKAVSYYATEVDKLLSPYDWYQALVVAGATENSLPMEYIRELESVRVVVDPDHDRREKVLKFLGHECQRVSSNE